MKFQIKINEDSKSIILDQSINLGELIDFLSSTFPNDAWKDITLEKTTETIEIPNTQPIIIDRYPYPYNPNPPWRIDVWYENDVTGKPTNNFIPDTNLNDYAQGTYTFNVNSKTEAIQSL